MNTRRLALLAIVCVVSGILGTVPGIAANTVGAFEIDGNMPDNSGSGEPIDWVTPPPNHLQTPDGSGSADDTFGSGSKENIPDEWDFVTSSVPGKTDITSGGVAFRRLNDNTFVYLNFTRATNTGDTFANFEMNKSLATFVNSKGDAVPVRTAGDILVGLFAEQGGQTLTVTVFTWSGNHLAGTWVPMPSGTQGVDWDAAVNADQNGRWTFAEAAVNFDSFGVEPSCPGIGAIWLKTTTSASFESAALADRAARSQLNLSNCSTKHWEFTFDPEPIAGAKVYAVYTVQPAQSREVELTDPNADGVYTAIDTQVPQGLVTYRFEVRTAGGQLIWSGPQDSEIFQPDSELTNTGSLHYDISLSPDSAENFQGDAHVFTARVSEVGTDASLPHVPVNFEAFGGTPNGCGSVAPASGSTDAAGNVTTTLSATGTCSTSIRAWVNGAGGTSGFDQGEGAESSTKSFVAYAISVEPPSASNEIGNPHTFTITLTKDTGSGHAGHAGQALTLTLSPGVSDAHFTDINGTPATGTAGTCTTDSNGQCTATIIATTPGDVTLTATYLASDSDGQTQTISGSGSKSYRTFALTATPDQATNEVGDPHTFTITLTQDGGSGPVGIQGETVELTLNPGTSDGAFTSVVNGTIVDDTHATCTTNAVGQCLATISATTPGNVTLEADWENATIVVGGASASADAGKTYLDFAMSVTPANATNEVGDPHTFTVTLTQNGGAGPAGLPGETVALVLAPGTSNAEFTEINGSPASGVSGSCSTDANGRCTATIVASTPGAVTLTASWENATIVAGGATRTADAHKQYLDFALSATPGQATNEVGDPHTFTVTLTQDSGAGPAGLAGESLTLELNPGASDAHFTEINGSPASGTSGSCTTDASGECAVTILASTPGSVTLSASWENATIVTGGAERSATANKQYLDFALAVTPANATNEVGDPHTFTATLTKDDGSGPAGFAGETMTLTLDPGASDAHFTEINGNPATGTSAPCVTNGDGKCVAIVTASTPGAITLTASWENATIVTGGASRTADADKQYLAFALVVTPADATNEVGDPHTFTATLTRDDGAGPAGLAGEELTLTLDPGTSDGHFTQINGNPASGTSGTCTTGAGGTCTVVATASTPGHLNLTASWSNATIVTGGASRTADADKTYLDFAMTVTPADGTNEVGDPHTFTVTLTKDDGTGPVALSGQSIDLTLDPGSSDAHFTEVNSVPATGTSATCTTTAEGTCVATINASTAGAVSFTADWENDTIVVGGTSRTAGAAKQYLDFALTATPANATNEVGRPHTFTITLTQDSGSGPVGLGGEALTLTLDSGNSDAHFTEVNGNPASGTTATCTTAGNGACTAIILASTPGAATLTADWANETIVAGGAQRTATAAKQYVDFDMTATPGNAYNLVNEPHTFTITLTRDEGNGPAGLPGELISLTLDPGVTDAEFTEINGVPASGTTGVCLTDTSGTCTVVINSTQPGAVSLTAEWENDTIVVGGAGRTASASKTYLRVTVAKTSCPTEEVVRGGVLVYNLSFSLEGATVTGTTLVDDLPAEVQFISAGPIAGVTPTESNGLVTWNFGSLPPGSYTGTITVRVLPTAPLNQPITNRLTFDADQFAAQSTQHAIQVGTSGKAASGRAFGISADLGPLGSIEPTPDSNVTNPGEVGSLPNPLDASQPLARVLDVSETDQSTQDNAAFTATSRVLGLNLVVPGTLTIQADSVVARSTSSADIARAGSTHSGSVIQNLRINGVSYGTISEPKTITLRLAGGRVAEIRLLERIGSGAAGGVPQPDGLFRSGLGVNGIHAIVDDVVPTPVDESLDMIVAHSDSDVAFPSGLACGGTTPAVSGEAFALQTRNVQPDAGSVEVAKVTLPIAGGNNAATLADIDLPEGLGTSDSVHASTEGEIADGPDAGTDPVQAASAAEVEGLDLLDGTITATVVRATASSTLGGPVTGDAVIGDLSIAGVPVCAECDPAPNSVFVGIPETVVLLNEQIAEPGGVTVNAVHVYVVGEGNPLGLPAGAEIVIASARAGTAPAAPAPAGSADTPAVGGGAGTEHRSAPAKEPAPPPGAPARIVKHPRLGGPTI